MLGVFRADAAVDLALRFLLRAFADAPLLQWLGCDPAHVLFEILRGIILRGAGLGDLWVPVTAMLGLGLFVLIAASVRFTRSGDA